MAIDLTKLARGKVVTGFGYPQVALYNAAAGVVTYSGVRDLARGVSISPQITTSSGDNILWLDNQAAERAKPKFRSGTLPMVVDGLRIESEMMIMGIPAEATETVQVGTGKSVVFTSYDNRQNIPYVGTGVTVQYQSNGIVFYQGFIYRKTQFDQFDIPAATEGQEIDWQTQNLTAQILVDDTARHAWKWFSELVETELEAYNAVRSALGGSPVEALPIL